MSDYSEFLTNFLAYGGILAAVSFAIYVYFAVLLMVIANKSKTDNAWMAWLPVFNIYLMCKIGRRSAAWIIMIFVPFLNIIGATVLWMSMAEARGKSKLLTALALIPPFTLFVPLYLAFGESTNPDAPAAPAGPAAGRLCSTCSTPAVPGDAFCGNCGTRVPAAAAVRPSRLVHRTPVGGMVAAGVAMLFLVTALTGIATWALLFREIHYAEPVRETPHAPAYSAGMMTEFPIDSDTVNPLKPTDIVTQSFTNTAGSTSSSLQAPAGWLPPGLDASTLSQQATAATTVAYAPKVKGAVSPQLKSTVQQQKVSSPGPRIARPLTEPDSKKAVRTTDRIPLQIPDTDLPHIIRIENDFGFPDSKTSAAPELPDDNVYITTLQPHLPNSDGRDLATAIAKASGGQTTRVAVTRPNGSTYNGFKIQNENIHVCVLRSPRVPAILIVYAPHPQGFNSAHRLVNNVGNGQGLMDPGQPALKNLFGAFPATPPAGLIMQDLNSYDLTSFNFEELLRQILNEVPPEIKNATQNFPAFVPERVSMASYLDAAQNEHVALVMSYPTTRNAWNLFTTMRFGVGSATGAKTIPLLDSTAFYWEVENDRWLLFQKGPRLLFIKTPQSTPLYDLQRFGNKFQL